MMQRLDRLARSSGLLIKSFKPHRAKVYRWYKGADLTVRVKGSEGQLMRFFRKLEGFPRVIKISKLGVDRAGPGMRVVGASIGVTMFWEKS